MMRKEESFDIVCGALRLRSPDEANEWLGLVYSSNVLVTWK